MKQLFADTFYWVALINERDDWHAQVIEITATLKNVKIITTDEILVEVLNFLSTYGIHIRYKTIELIQDIMKNSDIEVIQQTHDSFLEGLELYSSRLDKEYSLTDCISMNIMKRLKINEILTHDKHFTQEGFIIVFK